MASSTSSSQSTKSLNTSTTLSGFATSTSSSVLSSTASSVSISNTARPSSSGPGEGRDASASATLYLYTFLATLVLLLSVSAAIILRSIFLRRRHQRIVAEAIRNGTWVPPSPGGSGPFVFGGNGRRVDLSKKPALWEAFVGSGERHAQRTGKAEAVTEWEWDSIRPFAAAYVIPPGQNDPASVVSSAIPPERPTLTTRLHGLVRNRQQSMFPIPARMTAMTTTTPVAAAPLLSSASPPAGAPVVPAPPQKVRVAVLIAMPQPTEEKSRSPTPQPGASTSTEATPSHSSVEEEPQLPHIEFGVAELEVSSHNRSNHKDIRSSVASGSSVL